MKSTDPHQQGSHDFASPTVSLVLPCFNEVDNLRQVFAQIPDYVDEVVFVDGGSVDGSVELALSLRPDIKVLGQDAPGKGLALAIGLLAATSDIVVMADTDCSTDLSEMDDFIAALMAGADLAKGTRHLPPGGSDDFTQIRRMGNRLLVKVVNQLFGAKWTDLAYGYAAFWTDVIDKIGLQAICDLEVSASPTSTSKRPMAYGHGFEIETLLFCRVQASGYEVAEVPSHERERLNGTSNLSAFRDGFRVLDGIRQERWGNHRPELVARTSLEQRMNERRSKIDARLSTPTSEPATDES